MVTDSRELLADYAERGSQEAFCELVRRYLDMVYCTGVRLLGGDKHLAQDVAQVVFSDLARMAGSVSPDVLLGGWLHRHTCFVASKMLRGERRRLARERRAAEMNAINEGDERPFVWLAPVLDQAINQLGEADRKAILLRFFEELDMRSIGLALGASENAAQKRVSRALDELRILLGRRGVEFSAAALGAAIAGQVVSAAPTGLAGCIASSALAGAGGTGTQLGLIKLMAATKLKVLLLVIILAACVATLVHQRDRNAKLRAELAFREVEATPSPPPPAPVETAAARPVSSVAESAGRGELLRLRGEVGLLRRELSERNSRKPVMALSAAWNSFDLGQFPDSGAVIYGSRATNAGIATPAALLQTWLWALRTGDVEGRLRTTERPDDVSDEQWVEAAVEQAKHAGPGAFEEFRLAAMIPLGDDYFLAVFGENDQKGMSWVGRQVFHRANGEWKVVGWSSPVQK